MQLNIDKHNFCKLDGVAHIKNHLEKLNNVKLDNTKATGDIEINVSYNDFEGLECFKAIVYSFDLDLKELKILDVNIGKVDIYVVEGQGLDISYELVVNYLVDEQEAKEIELIPEELVSEKLEEPVKEEKPINKEEAIVNKQEVLEKQEALEKQEVLEKIKDEIADYYEDKLASNLNRNDKVIVTKSHQSVESFLDFFDSKSSYYKVKCLHVESLSDLEEIAKNYNVDLKVLKAGYDEQTHKVIFNLS